MRGHTLFTQLKIVICTYGAAPLKALMLPSEQTHKQENPKIYG